MTRKIITSYSALLYMAILMAGATTVHASEVTGTLSSNTSSAFLTTGSIDGTVSSGSNGTSGGGGGRRNGGISSNAPSGLVLGASDSTTKIPAFPNAGFNPEEASADHFVWSMMKTFFKNMFPF